ncbi:hypothetical protein FKZ14_14510 [Enterococcus faecalis]|nr:hypothetical protein FKZ14_14510 [Enterococcus faecalis]TQB60963.1 hypothetical protein FKZ15_14275 [Enterococcus faecalis]
MHSFYHSRKTASLPQTPIKNDCLKIKKKEKRNRKWKQQKNYNLKILKMIGFTEHKNSNI